MPLLLLLRLPFRIAIVVDITSALLKPAAVSICYILPHSEITFVFVTAIVNVLECNWMSERWPLT